MLEKLTATRFDRKMTSGRTEPCLMLAEDADGQEHEVVVKFSASCIRKEVDLVVEALAALLAIDLGLKVPRPFLVEIPDGFTSQLGLPDELSNKINLSSLLAFGSYNLAPGFTLWPKGKKANEEQVPQAAEIFSFDAIIANPDRIPNNPNCLTNGRDIAVIDHELSLQVGPINFGWQAPWYPSSLAATKLHLFFANLSKNKNVDLDSIFSKLQTLTPQRFTEYVQALPPEWLDTKGTSAAQEIHKYLCDLIQNAQLTQAECRRALS